MKTRKLFEVVENGRVISVRLRPARQARRAVRSLAKLGRDAYVSAISIDASQFDSNGRRYRRP